MQKLSATFENYLFWWVIGLSILIPLYPKFPLVNIPGTYVAIRLEDFLIALAMLFWMVAVIPKINKIFMEDITKSFLLFWGIGALSLFSGIFLTYTVLPHLGFFHYLRRVETMSLFLLSWTAIKNTRQIKVWLLVMFLVTVAIVLYGFGQQYLHFPVISTTNKEFSKGLILFLSPEARVNSTFAGHYDLAAYLAFFLTMLATFFFNIKGSVKKIMASMMAMFSFVLLALTAARVSFVAMLLGISACFWMTGRKKLIAALVLAALLALFISPDLRHRTVATLTVNLLGGGGAKYEPPPQMPGVTNKFSVENAATGEATPAAVPVDIVPGEPLNTTELGVFRSFGIRFNEEWPRAIRAFEKNPFLGTGYSSITIATDNDYLRSLGETGILGTTALVLIFLVIIKLMWRRIKHGPKDFTYLFAVGLFCGLLTVFITQTFIDVLESSKIAQLLWLSLGIGFAAVKLERHES